MSFIQRLSGDTVCFLKITLSASTVAITVKQSAQVLTCSPEKKPTWTQDQDTPSLFCSGNTNSEHNHPWSIHTACFFPVCFLYKRDKQKKKKSLSQSNAVKGDLRERIWKDAFSVTEHIPVICRKKGEAVVTDGERGTFERSLNKRTFC